MLTVTHNGKVYANWETADLTRSGVPLAVIGAAAKASAASEIARLANGWRAQVASASPGKLMEWQFKSQIAAAPDNADPAELALLDREAAARGLDRAALLDGITAKAVAYRRIALLIGALEAETKAAVAAVPDDAADIETQVNTALGAAKAQAEAAFAEAAALINGGS
ncbi:hypothetical protein [Leisingera sp. MMG026]|uniref:hypothetical protein n=1 Tax=Leisingera sp. MMG026 TaxID=2909982 RepID=UPI001F35B4B9|nr:hypothetical protein [Leisingera sp. MMG026]MCF6432601.1 hypothetical protein [Leisingera sp. MMG026]